MLDFADGSGGGKKRFWDKFVLKLNLFTEIGVKSIGNVTGTRLAKYQLSC